MQYPIYRLKYTCRTKMWNKWKNYPSNESVGYRTRRHQPILWFHELVSRISHKHVLWYFRYFQSRRERKEKNNGTWKKRGFSSLFGVFTLVDKYSKRFVDTMVKFLPNFVLKKFVEIPKIWKTKRVKHLYWKILWFFLEDLLTFHKKLTYNVIFAHKLFYDDK